MDKEKLILGTAPVLRGLTFRGGCGDTVIFEDNAGRTGLGLRNAEGQVLEARDPSLLSGAWREYLERNGVFPAVVSVPGAGIFALGADHAEAAGTFVKPREKRVKSPDHENGLSGRVAVVTGAARGFGEALARGLAWKGVFVFIADLDTERAKAVAGDINAEKGLTAAAALPVDVRDEASVRAMVSTVVRTAGGMDIFISNAGVLRAGSVRTMEAEDLAFVTDVNYTGYFLGVKHVSPVMALQNSMHGDYYTDIIQINSKSGLEGSSRNAAYAGSKFGGIGLTQSFALELVADRIKVNSICPGNLFDGPLWSDPENGLFVQYLKAGKVKGAETVGDVRKHYENKVPMGRGCTGEDVLKAVLYCIDQKYETGQAIPVTGGQVMLG